MPRIYSASHHAVRRLKPKELNTRRCPVCGAKPGQTCYVMTGTRFIELKVTHTTQDAPPTSASRTP